MTYRITNAPRFLYDNGVSFYECGVLTKNGVKMFDYYKADSITQSQKNAILNWCPLAEFKTASPQFAPELKSVLICFPKAGYFRERKALIKEQANTQAKLEFTN